MLIILSLTRINLQKQLRKITKFQFFDKISLKKDKLLTVVQSTSLKLRLLAKVCLVLSDDVDAIF
jgi:hypothetical protein